MIEADLHRGRLIHFMYRLGLVSHHNYISLYNELTAFEVYK